VTGPSCDGNGAREKGSTAKHDYWGGHNRKRVARNAKAEEYLRHGWAVTKQHGGEDRKRMKRGQPIVESGEWRERQHLQQSHSKKGLFWVLKLDRTVNKGILQCIGLCNVGAQRGKGEEARPTARSQAEK